MGFFLKTIYQFSEDRCTTLAASLAYYTVFALPPLLFLILSFVTAGLSLAYDDEMARTRAQELVQTQATRLLGNPQAAEQIALMLDRRATQPASWWTPLLSFAGILAAATGLLVALQDSLNQIWKVRAEQQKSGVKPFLRKRILSLAMILALGLLLLASLILSTVLTAAGDQITDATGIGANAADWINQCVTLLIVFIFFAGLFRFMPDAHIAWHDVWFGALVTTLLFAIGRSALQWYVAYSDPAQQLGSAAASLVAVLVWVYYSSITLLFGAECTQVWAARSGRPIAPEPGAALVITETVPAPATQEPSAGGRSG